MLIFFFFPGFSCSCPPFECVCGYQTAVPQQYLQHSPSNYQQNSYETYWAPEPVTTSYQENAPTPTQYDFTNFPNDLFQPEEIFQLDQPLRPDYNVQQTDLARSPPTLLDLGSGTIHREFKNEEYWLQNQQISNLVNDDSNNSSCSRIYLNPSPESRDTSLNNNITNDIDRLQFNLDPKVTDISTNYKFTGKSENDYFNQCVQIEDYNRSQTSFTDLVSDNRLFYGQEETPQNFAENFNDFKNYRYPDVRVQEKNDLVDLDLPPYVDYTTPSYENKIILNETIEVINDIDYRIQCASNAHYSESFDNIMTTN